MCCNTNLICKPLRLFLFPPFADNIKDLPCRPYIVSGSAVLSFKSLISPSGTEDSSAGTNSERSYTRSSLMTDLHSAVVVCWYPPSNRSASLEAT